MEIFLFIFLNKQNFGKYLIHYKENVPIVQVETGENQKK